jgi:hypothetical protein
MTLTFDNVLTIHNLFAHNIMQITAMATKSIYNFHQHSSSIKTNVDIHDKVK